jgi:hypothetical protein
MSRDTRRYASNTLQVGSQSSQAHVAHGQVPEVGMSAMRSTPDLQLPMLTGGQRPKPVGQVALKLPDGNAPLISFRFYEAAVRDLTHPATTGPW